MSQMSETITKMLAGFVFGFSNCCYFDIVANGNNV